ncbi:MAG: cytochrome c biogenesis protein CcsA [Alphaproteobacteria bacterium]
MPLERMMLLAGSGLYLAAALVAVVGALSGRPWGRRQVPALVLVALALVVYGVGILLRWDRLGHGPYTNMFEALISSIWSLHAAVLAGVLWLSWLRPVLAATLPVLQVQVLWSLVVPSEDGVLPVTYDTVWLPIHVWLGKVFLGLVVLALGGCLVILARRLLGSGVFPSLPSSAVLEETAGRLVLVGFVFQSLMLVAGAIWAQDAWGRYWDWDPLETWAFLNWVLVGVYLHLRFTVSLRPEWSAILVVMVFVLAFVAFFGMPFVSAMPHKGMI